MKTDPSPDPNPEKAILTKFFLLWLKLSRSRKPTTAKRYAEEMADEFLEFLREKSS